MSDISSVDLMRYLPDYYEENKEMTYLTDSENPEIDLLWDSIRTVKNNQFIKDADEFRIRQWEKLLRIRPNYKTQSLDFRKIVVILRLSTRIPLTYRWMVGKVAEVDPTQQYVITLLHDLYHLTVRLGYEERELAKELYVYLREKIPANLGLIMEIYFRIDTTLTITTGAVFFVREKINISNYSEKVSVKNNFAFDRIQRIYEKINISNYAVKAKAYGRLNYGCINILHDRFIIA